MKIVAFRQNGQPGVGLVSADLQKIQPFDLLGTQREFGALPVIEMQARGEPLPALLPPVALRDVQITAPLPRPRRNIFCVGKTTLRMPGSLPTVVLTAALNRARTYRPTPSSLPRCPNP